jgi:hypothetical protein
MNRLLLLPYTPISRRGNNGAELFASSRRSFLAASFYGIGPQHAASPYRFSSVSVACSTHSPASSTLAVWLLVAIRQVSQASDSSVISGRGLVSLTPYCFHPILACSSSGAGSPSTSPSLPCSTQAITRCSGWLVAPAFHGTQLPMTATANPVTGANALRASLSSRTLIWLCWSRCLRADSVEPVVDRFID